MATKLYRLKQGHAFTVWEDGVLIPYNDTSKIYTADHPVVKKNLGAFEEIVPIGPPNAKVEQATAGPGEKR